MRKIFLGLVALMIMLCQTAQAQPSPQWIKNLPAAKNSNQMIVVAWIKDSDALVSMHEKNSSGEWEQIMETAGFVGRKGIGKTRQGDGKSPRGTFTFNYAFGIAPDPGCAIPYVGRLELQIQSVRRRARGSRQFRDALQRTSD